MVLRSLKEKCIEQLLKYSRLGIRIRHVKLSKRRTTVDVQIASGRETRVNS